jgi:hypothetical protein
MYIDIAVCNFNGKETLELTLRSVFASTNVEIGMVYIIDDGSTDGSQKIAENFDKVTLIQLSKNTKKVNLVRNVGLQATKTDRVLLTDNDIEFAPNCLEKLNQVMDEGEDIVAVTPRLLYMDDRDRIYLDSCGFHYIGASTARKRHQLMKDVDSDLSPSPTMSSGILLLNKKIIPDGCGFDESLPFSWGTDGEFYYRMTFMGFRSLINPQAVAYHKDKNRTVERAEGHITTRWYMLLTYYSWKTLILLIPVLIFYEFIQFGFFTAKKIPHLYIKYNWLNLIRLKSTMKKRRKIQARRKLKDHQILGAEDIYIVPNLIKNPLSRCSFTLLNLCLKTYWGLIKIFI